MNARTRKTLGTLADELERKQVEIDALYARRSDVWAAATAAGDSAVEIAAASRVKPGAVRQWIFRRKDSA